MGIALIGLALAWAVMLLFGAMEFDRGLLLFGYAGESPWLGTAARWVTELGGAALLLPATGIGFAILFQRRAWRDAGLLALITLSGRLLVELQKGWTARVRPDAMGHLVPVESLSFPSGHAANATMVWLCLALLLPRQSRTRTLAVWAAVWVALLVGVSRVMLGVHWPSDVVGGWAFGLFWTLLVLRLAGLRFDQGTAAATAHSGFERRSEMADRTRPDDHELIDQMEDTPGQSGASGGNLQRDVASRAEQEHEIGDGDDHVTRVHGADKPDKGDRPNLPNRDRGASIRLFWACPGHAETPDSATYGLDSRHFRRLRPRPACAAPPTGCWRASPPPGRARSHACRLRRPPPRGRARPTPRSAP